MSGSRNPNVLGFGKYKGRRLTDPNVPESYLRWMVDQAHRLDPRLRLAAERELERRHAEDEDLRDPGNERPGLPFVSRLGRLSKLSRLFVRLFR